MSGHVAIVTGGLRGLGRAMTLGLLRTGRRVLAVGHIAEDVAEMQRLVAGEPFADALACLVADLHDAAACDRVIEAAQRQLGGLHILVNNAGLTFTYIDPDRFEKGPRKFWTLPDEVVETVMDINFVAAERMARRAAPLLIAQGWGRIVNVTTKLSTMNAPGSVPYGPSKAALEMATEIWAKELAGTGVTANIVNPGAGANTPGMGKTMRDWSAAGKAPKLVEPEDMVPPLLFVVSREADAVNGYRFDANAWDAALPPAEAARRSGRRAGFDLHPVSDCFAESEHRSTLPAREEKPAMAPSPRPLDARAITPHRRGKGEPLTLLHCLGMSWRFWDVLEPLTDRFELIAYSFPGHHDTPLPGHSYGVPELSRQLYEVLRREGIGKTHLMGISLGGSVAQHFAGTYPEMVDKLVLADCTPRYDDEARANWPKRAEAARKNGVASLIPMLLPIWFSAPSLAEDGPNVRFVKETLAACSGEGYALACEALATLDARKEAKRITAPTLILCGSEERQPFHDAARWMHETIRGSRLEIVPMAGHASVRERPEHVIPLLRDFLS